MGGDKMTAMLKKHKVSTKVVFPDCLALHGLASEVNTTYPTSFNDYAASALSHQASDSTNQDTASVHDSLKSSSPLGGYDAMSPVSSPNVRAKAASKIRQIGSFNNLQCASPSKQQRSNL